MGAAAGDCSRTAQRVRGLLAEQVEAVRQQVVDGVAAHLGGGRQADEVVARDGELVGNEQVRVQDRQRSPAGSLDVGSEVGSDVGEGLREVPAEVGPGTPRTGSDLPARRRPPPKSLHQRGHLFREQPLCALTPAQDPATSRYRWSADNTSSSPLSSVPKAWSPSTFTWSRCAGAMPSGVRRVIMTSPAQ